MYTETGKQFGEGGFGKVVEVVDATGQRFAKKICTREKYMYNTEYEKTCMENLKQGNPRHRGYHHVVHLEKAERNQNNTGWELIMDCYEGNLLELMEKQHTYDEFDAMTLNALPEDVVRDLALHASFGLAYMATLGYAHTDLKPENILWKKSAVTKSGYHFSIADFGNVLEQMDQFKTIQTRQYMCTENLLRVASVTECDMPSMACILYEAIVGDFLTNHKHQPHQISAHLEAIGKHTLELFDSREIPAIEPYLKNVTSRRGHLAHPDYPLQKSMQKAGYIFSKDITDLIAFMLIPYPQQRIKAKNVCKHAWFDSEDWYRMADPMILDLDQEDKGAEAQEDKGEEEQDDQDDKGEEEQNDQDDKGAEEQDDQDDKGAEEQDDQDDKGAEYQDDKGAEYQDDKGAEDQVSYMQQKEDAFYKMYSKKVPKDIRNKQYREKRYLKMIDKMKTYINR